LFDKKNKDYGTSWRILRLSSLTDQIFIKAQRIRSIQEKGAQKIEDGIEGEFIGIINYCIIALIQKSLEGSDQMEFATEELGRIYDEQVEITLELLRNKNHDYGEAWRDMRISSMTDLILMKIFRTKQIENNDGVTLVSEGVEANYQDMLNYAVFCLITLKGEQQQQQQQ
jgi:hypothetical protein